MDGQRRFSICVIVRARALCAFGHGGPKSEQSRFPLLLVHPDTTEARQSVQAVIEVYRKPFEQQSVLWENARVCVAT